MSPLRLPKGGHRVLFPVALVVALRVSYAALLYATLNVGGVFRTPFMSIWNSALPFDWLYLFSAWDTSYYHSIAVSWYPAFQSPLWAFFPLFPTLSRLLILVGLDSWLALFTIATACGLLSIPIFLKVAEKYLAPNQAMIATILYFLLPAVFVFTGVSYSEPVFLLFGLLSWYFHKEQKDFYASVSAALCSLARSYGILIIIPLGYDYLKHKEPRKLVYLLIPLFALGAWAFYGTLRTHVLAPMITAGSYWHTPTASAVLTNTIRLVGGDLTAIAPLLPYAPLALTIVASLALTAFLGYLTRRVDKGLALYVLVTVCSIIVAGRGSPAAYRSFPRFLGFLFPVGLALYTGRRSLLAVTVIAFVILDFVAWWAFLADGFY